MPINGIQLVLTIPIFLRSAVAAETYLAASLTV